MADPTSVPSTQRDNGLGHWHPAQRPEGLEFSDFSHGHDEQRIQGPLHSVSEADIGQDSSKQEVGLDSGTTAEHQLTAQTAPEDDHSESQISDGAHLHQETPYATDMAFPVHEEGVGTPERKEVRDTIEQANHNDSKSPNEDGVDIRGEKLGFLDPPKDEVDDGQARSQESATAFQPGLTWNIENQAATTMSDAEPSFGNRANTERFQRTNSFPDMPPLPQPSMLPHSFPHTQAQTIMEVFENEEALANGFDEPLSSKPTVRNSLLDTSDDHSEEVQNDFFSTSSALQDGHMPSLPDEEARFEEGLPLMHNLDQEDVSQSMHQESVPQGGPRYPAGYAEEQPFDKPLASVSTDEDLFRPPVLDRKTTNQVLNSMQYPPQSETHDDRQRFDERSPPADLTRDGTDVPPDTANSQIPSGNHSNSQGRGSTDEDLAALWQAALDDDELLDDDGEADPSSLFEDDAEGFLEDDQNSAPTQSASSPLLQPVYSPGGSMQGLSHAQSTNNSKDRSMSDRYFPSTVPQQHHQSSRKHQLLQGHSNMNQQPIQTTNGLNNPFSASTGSRTLERQQLSYGYATSSSRPQMPSSAQSFADKAKGGYTSPYDLPMDLSRPKKRNLTQQLRPGSSNSTIPDRPPAPPRSSSMFAGVTPVVESQPPVPTLPKQPNALSSLPHLGTAVSVTKAKESAGSFFEELPSVKPRPVLATSRTHTVNAPQGPPPPSTLVPQQSQQSHARQRPASSSSNNHPGYGLVPPGPISPYANTMHQGFTGPALPSANARYSPAPVPSSTIPPSRTRYAASPAGGARAPPSTTLPFQPRTSSPLAQNHLRPRAPSDIANADDTSGAGSIPSPQESTEGHAKVHDGPSSALHSSQPQREPSEHSASHWASSDPRSLPDRSLSNHFSPPAHPTTRYGPTSSSLTPSHSANAPVPRHLRSSEHSGFENQYTTSPPPDLAPPRRSQTQSPGAMTSKPTLPTMTKEIYQRPASVNDRSLPQTTLATPVTSSHGTQANKGLSQTSEYIRPTDGRENDPLERWKGCPLFAFGFGGTVVTSFPKKVQRYGARHNIPPLIKCSPGEVKIQPRDKVIFDSKFAGFPGPLKAKGKKKEVLNWLQRQIHQLEQDRGQIVGTGLLPDPRIRSEEKILLWKVMNVLVEHDGVIEGKSTAEKAIRSILSPELVKDNTPNMPANSNSHLLGISGASGPRTIPISTEVADVEILRRILLEGERDRAVWHAVDRRLWAHAMLISSTMDQPIWKQVLQEFIRQEVKSVGSNTESLASLYQIFAGNWEESIDELVPPSARAGLQFVSKAAGTGPTRNALDGLDRWRETLTLALSNRTHGDGEALIALGRLLAGYGRVEAAHICFIFAKAPATFGGSDDPQASVTLLGADHVQHPLDFSRDIDSILLTEVYEFACSILAPSPSITTSPHFQAYKLYHAMLLAEHGSRTDAQEYCSVITSAMKSTTKLSPYYHSLLFTSLDDLVNRLRQAPSVNTASWMSKPSLDRVSGSFLSRVNQFIAGEESDADSAGSTKGTDLAAGPFAGVTGDTPNISRSPSSTDLYSTYPSAPPPVNPIASTSRYAPGGQYAVQGQYTPRSSFEQSHGNLQDYRSSIQNETLRPQPPTASRPGSSGHVYQQPPQQAAKSSYQPISQPSKYPMQQESYPTPPSIPETVSIAPPEELSPSLYGQEPFRHASIGSYQTPQGFPQLVGGLQEDDTQQVTTSPDKSAASVSGPTQSIYQPPSYEYNASSTPEMQSSYEPPTTGFYEPPVSSSSDAGTQPDNSSPVEEKLKKKTFLDDDEDGFEARAAALLKQDKARKDREAEEAFRKAAEADGMLRISPHDVNENLQVE